MAPPSGAWRPDMRRYCWNLTCGLGLLIGCSDAPDGPAVPVTATPLETIPLERVGPGRLVFLRYWPWDGRGVQRPPAVYLLDGTAGRSWGLLVPFEASFPLAVTVSPDGQRVLFDWA